MDKDYFKGIIGYEHVKLELCRIIDAMQNIEEYKKLGVRTTRGLLLDGDPGVGKTTMAKAVITASGRPCFTVRKDASSGDLVKVIKKVFDTAKKEAPSIVFLDDLDKFSNEDSYHRNSDEFITVQSCIDDCKDDEIMVIATANELDCLPDSLLRPGRFDKHITVENPTGADAEEIIKYYLSKQKVSEDVDCKDVVKFLNGNSCATLEAVINEAGIHAAYERRDCVDMNDVINAFLRLAFDSPDMLSEKENKQLMYTAVHEAGHTVASEITNPNSVVVATVKKHQSDKGGFTKLYYNDDYDESENFETLENQLLVLLAGKAAVEIVYGTPDIGCKGDITRAEKLLDFMFEDICGYDFTLYGYINRWEDGLDIQSKHFVIQHRLSEYYLKAKRLLIENRKFFDAITQALMEKKTITFKDIDKIKKELEVNN